jgi:hypothetical protein
MMHPKSKTRGGSNVDVVLSFPNNCANSVVKNGYTSWKAVSDAAAIKSSVII